MKVLLSSIGSRGDVQPILALAVELSALGHAAVVCAAPNFQTWVESYGIDFVPSGPDLENWTRSNASSPIFQKRPTLAQRRMMASGSVVEQFRVLPDAARGCDLIVVAGMLQTAGHSIAQAMKIPYVYAAYSPVTLPSPDHAPTKLGEQHPDGLAAAANLRLWQQDTRTSNSLFRAAINEQRAALGLPPIQHVPRYVTTGHPWLAADPVLFPAAVPHKMEIYQSGAWFLPDSTPLPDEVEQFLADGEPPIYLGFGSMRAAAQTGQLMVDAARAVGKRAIIYTGWAQLNGMDVGPDCLAVGSLNHSKLLPRVAVVAHHGGAGTTTAAARAGKAQVIVPHNYDQYYSARRVRRLGIGTSIPHVSSLRVDLLVGALRGSLQPEVAQRAAAMASRIELHGARIAAERLDKLFG